jgi:two-component system LytT family sensor kinase
MLHAMPDYLLISELLGYSTGTVLSIVLALLVRRASHRATATRLLAFCALLWNVFGLLMIVLVLSGMGVRSWPVNLAHAASGAGGAIFPISFLLLWSRPLAPRLWQAKVSRWLLRLSICNAAWITALLFLCPCVPSGGLWRSSMYSLSLNASLLLTIGALTLVRGRLSAAADRMYLTLTLLGVWGSTTAIFVLDQVHLSPRLEAALVIAKEQSPFLAVLGALFFFANLRSADVLIKHSLRVVAAVGYGLCAWFFVAETLPHLAVRFSAFPLAAAAGFGAATIAALLVLFSLVDQAIGRTVDCWILRQPDYHDALRQLWDEMVQADSEPDLFALAGRNVSEVLHLAAAPVLRRGAVVGIESHAEANVGRLWELSCDDPCRRVLPGHDVDVLVPVRVHGNITHVVAVAPGPSRRGLLNGDLAFLRSVAGQIGRRLEALAHERERIERQNRESNLRQLAAQAELKALRAQINPHFLFNSLNTVADLIVTDPAKAEVMTLLLAKVFRHVLMQSDRQLTRVAEEMEFLRTYLHIEEVRFGDRLHVRMELDPRVSSASIPSLILQPVVENAIKHGLAPKIGEGNLSITADREGEFVRLAVEDDGVGPAPAGASEGSRNGSGVGLKIIAERLRALYDGRASLRIEKAAAAVV